MEVIPSYAVSILCKKRKVKINFKTDLKPRYLCWICSDPPGKPGSPLIEDVGEEYVSLSWTKPKGDGGNKVSGYVVEVKEVGTGKWVPMNAKSPVNDTKFKGLFLFIFFIFISIILFFLCIQVIGVNLLSPQIVFINLIIMKTSFIHISHKVQN